jgi:hypothetical protein
MEKTETRGGKREGAGRKPSKDPLVPMYISLNTSVVDILGGKDKVRETAQKHLNRKAKNAKKPKENTHEQPLV